MVREHKLEEASLDRDIASLKRQVASLRKKLQLECSTILSAASTQNLIQSATSSARSSNAEALAKRSSQQEAYVQQCAYRISTSVTAFKIHDPDPNAVDSGNVLGIRFEVMSTGQFLRPYYVMLNRPYADSRHLRVHRHTIPAAIPLSGLAARHLPPPRFDGMDQTTQDLQRFVRTLRRDIIRYHNRLGVTADLRRSARLNQKARGAQGGRAIVDVGIADIEAKQISLTWADDRTGRIIVDEDGKILKFVVFGSGGRDWDRSDDLLGSSDRVEDIVTALDESTKT